MLLSVVNEEMDKDRNLAFSTFSKYEKMVDRIYNNEIEPAKIDALKSLKDIASFNQKEGCKIYHEFFEGELN